ncbi:hypothetical protein Tco_1058626 [Tanacetum coccineum]|uniref:Uncharacterized protein n=1 Tax=Tanacetum coccineum TaxID=301880 RepID=A0ABQ5HA20_9ASTR
MEMKDTLSSCLYSDEQDMQQMLKRAKILKGSCLNGLSALKSNFTRKLEQGITKSEFERAFSHIFGEDVDTFTRTFSQNMDTLEQQLTKETILEHNVPKHGSIRKTTDGEEEFQRLDPIASFKGTRDTVSDVHQVMDIQTTEGKVDTGKAVDASLVNTESIGTESKEQDTSSRSGNDAHADDADIRPIYDEEPMVEVQTTAEINIFATGQQHTEQPEFNNEGKVDQNVEQCHDTCPLPAKLTDNQTTELSYQSLESENICTNDMGVHNPYLEEAKKKTQESCRNSKPNVMPSARLQSTANGSKPKPRINNQKSRNWPASKSSCVTTKTVPIAEHSRNSRSFYDSEYFVCSTCQKCVFNANHDSCVTKFLNEVNSRAKVPSNKTTKRYIPVEQTSFAKKPERQIPKRHWSLLKKTSVVHEKTMTPRSCLRWKPTGKLFKTVGLKWIPTGKIFTSSTTKVDSEPTNGSNDIFKSTKEGTPDWLLKRLILRNPGLQGFSSDE